LVGGTSQAPVAAAALAYVEKGDGGAACYAFDGVGGAVEPKNENSHQSSTTEATDGPGTSTRPRASEPAAGPDEIVGNKKSDKYIDVNGSCG
jgi:hypothetical protein